MIAQKNKAKTRKSREYTISEFMSMRLPAQSKKIEAKLGDAYIGPFTKRYRKIQAAHDVRSTALQPVLRKLDLLLASKDTNLIDAASRMKDASISSISDPKKVDAILKSPLNELNQGFFELSADPEWETWPFPEDEIYRKSSRQSTPTRPKAVFTLCHEVVEELHHIWIPELVDVFSQLSRLLPADKPISKSRKGRA